MNLLVVGSPASNHLARIVNRSAIFRFNYGSDVDKPIEEVIGNARRLTDKELVGYQDRERRSLVGKMRSLFTGGIVDPTHPDEYIVAKYGQLASNTQLDFGVLTFGANPYYVLKCKREGRVCDHKYVSIMAAGIHHPATAHALRLLGEKCRGEGIFDKHPYGGVTRVELDLNVPFPTRTMEASCRWEDMADRERKPADDQKAMLLDELKIIGEKLRNRELKSLALSEEQAAECRKLVESL